MEPMYLASALPLMGGLKILFGFMVMDNVRIAA